jgi:hypothetical protein
MKCGVLLWKFENGCVVLEHYWGFWSVWDSHFTGHNLIQTDLFIKCHFTIFLYGVCTFTLDKIIFWNRDWQKYNINSLFMGVICRLYYKCCVCYSFAFYEQGTIVS